MLKKILIIIGLSLILFACAKKEEAKDAKTETIKTNIEEFNKIVAETKTLKELT